MGGRQLHYLALKSVNLVLAAGLGFVMVAMLIRRLPGEAYATFVILSAVGSYVLATDLGFSSVVYARVRKAFLLGETREERHLPFTAFGLYLLVTAAAALGVTVWLALTAGALHGLQWALAVYFLSFVLALPWGVVRGAAGATDLFMRYEAVEAVRRGVLLAMAFCIPLGLSLMGYALGSLGLWVFAYAAVLPPLRRALGEGGWAKAWRPRAILRDNARQMGGASLFSILEFFIYNFPYFAVPAMFGKGLQIVQFDVFFRITRFGALSYQVANEGMLPANTRAIHDANAKIMARNLALGLGVSSVACLCGILAVTVFGDKVFGLLLGDATKAPQFLRLCMAIMLGAMMFQAASGTLLLNTGKSGLLARISSAMAATMAAVTTAAVVLHWAFPVFMGAYVGAFAVGAAVYFAILLTLLRRMSARGAW